MAEDKQIYDFTDGGTGTHDSGALAAALYSPGLMPWVKEDGSRSVLVLGNGNVEEIQVANGCDDKVMVRHTKEEFRVPQFIRNTAVTAKLDGSKVVVCGTSWNLVKFHLNAFDLPTAALTATSFPTSCRLDPTSGLEVDVHPDCFAAVAVENEDTSHVAYVCAGTVYSGLLSNLLAGKQPVSKSIGDDPVSVVAVGGDTVTIIASTRQHIFVADVTTLKGHGYKVGKGGLPSGTVRRTCTDSRRSRALTVCDGAVMSVSFVYTDDRTLKTVVRHEALKRELKELTGGGSCLAGVPVAVCPDGSLLAVAGTDLHIFYLEDGVKPAGYLHSILSPHYSEYRDKAERIQRLLWVANDTLLTSECELGPLSPLRVECHDRPVTLSDFINDDLIELLERFYGMTEFSGLSKDEVGRLQYYDLMLDLPRVALLDPSYDNLRRLMRIKYHAIPREWANDTDVVDLRSDVCPALVHGHVDVVDWAYRVGGQRCNRVSFELVIRHGHLHVLEWLRDHGLERPYMIKLAARWGYIHIIRWARLNHRWDEAYHVTTERSYMDCLKYLLDENQSPWNDRVCSKTNMECLKYIHKHERPWDSGCNLAAEVGCLECLKYMHENGCDWWYEECEVAAEGGHLECLKYLHEHGCEWNEETCHLAASGGHLECLKYLHEHGCYWSEWTCAVAAATGNIDCLKYLHENGCPWDEDARCAAAAMGRLECLQYLHENGCPHSYNSGSPWDSL